MSKLLKKAEYDKFLQLFTCKSLNLTPDPLVFDPLVLVALSLYDIDESNIYDDIAIVNSKFELVQDSKKLEYILLHAMKQNK